MKYIAPIIFVATTGLLLTTNLSLAAKELTREAIMHRCNAHTLKVAHMSGSMGQRRRSLVWKDCMVAHGQLP